MADYFKRTLYRKKEALKANCHFLHSNKAWWVTGATNDVAAALNQGFLKL